MQMALGFDTPPLRLAVLGSGSGGNSLVLECGDDRLMVDAGFSCRELERRLGRVGVDPRSLGAMVLTHEHGDHSRGARRFGWRNDLPVYATEGTRLQVAWGKQPPRLERIRSGYRTEMSGFEVEPFLVPHDAREPVGLVVEDRFGRRVGVVADLGARSRLAWGRLRDLDALVLETNHDLTLLREGPYPWPLKQRIAGRHGHLSNREAAEGLDELVNDRLSWVVLYHLSRTNNRPELASGCVGERLDRLGCRARVQITEQGDPTPWMTVGEAAPREAADDRQVASGGRR